MGDAPPCTHDEDGDGKLDCVDNCPGIANADQADRDHDGVGDACDPFPTLGSDLLVAADYFDVTPTTFIPSDGWTLGSDAVTSPAASGTINTLATDKLDAPSATVELTLVPATYEIAAQLDITIAYNDNTFLDCQLTASQASDPLDQITITTDKQGIGTPMPIPANVAGVPVPIKVTFATNTSTCEIGGTTYTGPTSGSEPSAMASVTISLKAMSGAINYAILYGHHD